MRDVDKDVNSVLVDPLIILLIVVIIVIIIVTLFMEGVCRTTELAEVLLPIWVVLIQARDPNWLGLGSAGRERSAVSFQVPWFLTPVAHSGLLARRRVWGHSARALAWSPPWGGVRSALAVLAALAALAALAFALALAHVVQLFVDACDHLGVLRPLGLAVLGGLLGRQVVDIHVLAAANAL